MLKKGKAYKISHFIIIFLWIIFTASAGDAELKIKSVSPNQGIAGQELGEQYLLHHDVEYLSNGNVLMIAWEYAPSLRTI